MIGKDLFLHKVCAMTFVFFLHPNLDQFFIDALRLLPFGCSYTLWHEWHRNSTDPYGRRDFQNNQVYLKKEMNNTTLSKISCVLVHWRWTRTLMQPMCFHFILLVAQFSLQPYSLLAVRKLFLFLVLRFFSLFVRHCKHNHSP